MIYVLPILTMLGLMLFVIWAHERQNPVDETRPFARWFGRDTAG